MLMLQYMFQYITIATAWICFYHGFKQYAFIKTSLLLWCKPLGKFLIYIYVKMSTMNRYSTSESPAKEQLTHTLKNVYQA